jgi:hypothetical protein
LAEETPLLLGHFHYFKSFACLGEGAFHSTHVTSADQDQPALSAHGLHFSPLTVSIYLAICRKNDERLCQDNPMENI